MNGYIVTCNIIVLFVSSNNLA